ncbi:hypothetical protein [Halobacterium yunchengense]|uniref:hypothetical protein n=1 Tax=Halobacterium yunchengense TaxID=3108497 RepID=UPI0030098871
MLQIRCAAGRGDRREPVLSREGDRAGTVVDREDGARYVAVAPDAPAHVCDALDCEPGADRVPLPDALVAADGDAVRLVV